MSTEHEKTAWRFDAFVDEQLAVEDGALAAAAERSRAEGLPPIQVSAPHGKLLEMLCRLAGAQRVLEIGTLGGYSTISLARGVGDGGAVVTLELDPHHGAVARRNLEEAGVAERVEVVVGAALDSLDAMVAEGAEPFDLFFIDADKKSNRAYLERALLLSRPGSVIYVDNVVRGGAVIDDGDETPDVLGTRAMFELLGAEPRLEATAIQTVGTKGYDGFVLARVIS